MKNHIDLYGTKWIQEAFLNGPIWELYNQKKERKSVSVLVGRERKVQAAFQPFVLLRFPRRSEGNVMNSRSSATQLCVVAPEVFEQGPTDFRRRRYHRISTFNLLS